MGGQQSTETAGAVKPASGSDRNPADVSKTVQPKSEMRAQIQSIPQQKQQQLQNLQQPHQPALKSITPIVPTSSELASKNVLAKPTQSIQPIALSNQSKIAAKPVPEPPRKRITVIGPLQLTDEQLKSFTRSPVESCILHFGAKMSRNEIAKMTEYDILTEARSIAAQWLAKEKILKSVDELSKLSSVAYKVDLPPINHLVPVRSNDIDSESKRQVDALNVQNSRGNLMESRGDFQNSRGNLMESRGDFQKSSSNFSAGNFVNSSSSEPIQKVQSKRAQLPSKQISPNVSPKVSPMDAWMNATNGMSHTNLPSTSPNPFEFKSIDDIHSSTNANSNNKSSKIINEKTDMSDPTAEIKSKPSTRSANRMNELTGTSDVSTLSSPLAVADSAVAASSVTAVQPYHHVTMKLSDRVKTELNETHDHDSFLQHISQTIGVYEKQVQFGSLSNHYWTEEDKRQHSQLIERTRATIKEIVPKLEHCMRQISSECNQRKQDLDACMQFSDETYVQHQQRMLTERVQLLDRYKSQHQQIHRLLK